jgi:CrcB protein
MTVILVAAAAFAGAACRYMVDLAVQRRTGNRWPLGTLVVNATGALALGLLVGIGLRHGLDTQVHTVAGTGFLGAYTTFSTFALDAVVLADEGTTLALAMVAVSTTLGLAAAGAGLALATL